MKTFLVLLSAKQRELMNEKLIRGHVEYLNSLWEKRHLIFCGPCTDGTAIMLLQSESLESIKELLQNDPFSKVMYYQSVEIKEVQDANPNNNFHLDEVFNYLSSK